MVHVPYITTLGLASSNHRGPAFSCALTKQLNFSKYKAGLNFRITYTADKSSFVFSKTLLSRHLSMPPSNPLPTSDEFSSAEHYVSSLLDFASTNDLFQILCGGVHILDFFTNEPGLFEWVLEPEWQEFLMECDPMALLDFLLRDDPDAPETGRSWPEAPESLRQYVKDIRRLSLKRSFTPVKPRLPVIPRQVAVGMNVKKKHEVINFADYVDRLAADIARLTGTEMTHFIDFGSGQNYLGRTLASAPYSKDIVAVERHEHNQAGARELDVLAGIAETEKVLRNKKIWQSLVDSKKDANDLDEKARRRKAEQHTAEQIAAAELRPRKELEAIYRPEEGRGLIKYVTGRLETGDLSEVLNKIHDADIPEEKRKELSLMAISIHSCGNLSHFGIRSMILNPSIKAVAIVGCCYNLLTEKLGPPTYKLPYMRPSLQAVNGRVVRESEKYDPQGFPMSNRVSCYNGRGIRFNITARMMGKVSSVKSLLLQLHSAKVRQLVSTAPFDICSARRVQNRYRRPKRRGKFQGKCLTSMKTRVLLFSSKNSNKNKLGWTLLIFRTKQHVKHHRTGQKLSPTPFSPGTFTAQYYKRYS